MLFRSGRPGVLPIVMDSADPAGPSLSGLRSGAGVGLADRVKSARHQPSCDQARALGLLGWAKKTTQTGHFPVGLIGMGGGGRESPLKDACLDHLREMALHQLVGVQVELLGQPRRGAPVAPTEPADHGSERLLARALAQLSDLLQIGRAHV